MSEPTAPIENSRPALAPSPEAAPETRLAALLNRPGAVALVFIALTIVMTFPLAFRLTSHVPAGAVDLWQNYWNFWWWEHCVLHFKNPYFTDYLFHPSGADMAFYTHSVFNMISMLPVTALFGPGAAYNMAVLVQTALSGWAAWLLARELTGDARAALLAGLIFTFFPQRLEQTTEHLNLMSTGFIPLIFYFLLRLTRPEATRRHIIGLGLVFAFNALTDWHLGLMTTLIAAPVALMWFLKSERPKSLMFRDTALAAALAAVITLPFVWPLIQGLASGASWAQKTTEPRGVDLVFTLLPHFNHPVFGGLTRAAYAGRAYEAAGFTSYLGFVPLALATFALVRQRLRAWVWLAAFVVSFLLALGAHPWINSVLHEEITLPFAFFADAPMLSFLRIANRFMIYASLALAVLAALGWAASRRRSDRAFLVVSALILIEYLWLPYPTQPLRFSPGLDLIAKDRSAASVLPIPFNVNGRTVQNMVDQTRHNKKIAGGYLSTTPPEPKAEIENEAALMNLVGDGMINVEPAVDQPINAARLRELGFGWILLRKDRMDSRAEELRRAADPDDLFQRKILTRIGGLPDAKAARLREELNRVAGPPAYEDDELIIWNLLDHK